VIKLGKILVVDDQVGIRTLLVETFQDDQYDVEMAANGLEALQLLTTFQPDLILLDFKMPGLNGIETLEKIRVLDRRVAVIMMTAYSGDLKKMEQETDDLEILHYISKPFNLFDLREQVRKILSSST